MLVCGNRIGRIDQQGYDGRPREQFVQQLQLLRRQFHVQSSDTRELPPGRFMLVTSPASIGSVERTNTIGMVAVAA